MLAKNRRNNAKSTIMVCLIGAIMLIGIFAMTLNDESALTATAGGTIYTSPTTTQYGSEIRVDTTPPTLDFLPPTPANNSYRLAKFAEINISIAEQNLDTFKFNWNGTNYTMYNDSLVLAMNFNNNSAIGENSTYAVDISKYGNNGTIYGATWTSSGKFGSALSFDGVDDYVEVADSPSLDITDNITLEAWFNPLASGWAYKKPITITNPGSALTNFQVLVTVDTKSLIEAGKMQSDCGDIRFFDGNGNNLSYWIESGCKTTETKIWVKVPSVPAGDSTIYMYYGNPSASSASNVTNTFIREIDGAQPVKGSWHFDEGSCTIAKDTSGNANDGTLVNNPSWVDGKFGKALSFDGTDDYVRTVTYNLNYNSTFSFAAWIKTSAGGTIVSQGDDTTNQDEFGTKLGVSPEGRAMFSCERYAGAWYHIYGSIVNDNNWHLVVAVYNNTDMKIYVDSVLDGSGTYGETTIAGNQDFCIACWSRNNVDSGHFNGIIDEVQIYNRALTAEEISDLYNNYGYTTTNYPGRVLIRKYASPEPTTSVGEEVREEVPIWIYKKPITITNPGSALTDYQLLVTVDTQSLISARKMQANCADIRFRDVSDSDLSYWIESGCNTTETKIWVKVPSIPTGESTIYMYYGNPYAPPASNVTNTFIREIDGAQPVKGSWHFDEGSGTIAKDTSGNANDGTLVNNPSWVDGKFGKALNFDGTDDYVRTVTYNLNYTSTFSFVAWIKTSAEGTIVSQGDDTTNQDEFGTTLWVNSEGRAVFSCERYAGAWYHIYGSIVNDNNWHLVVAVYNNTDMKIYVDSVLKGSGTYGDTTIAGNQDFCIACYSRNNVDSGHFNGIIDEVQIYNRALTAEEISDLYNNYGYTTTNYPGRVLIRKYASPEPTTSVGSETAAGISKAGAYGIGANTTHAFASINGKTISGAIASGWNHIALTYDCSFQKLFLNGELKTSQVLTGTISTNNLPLLIGDLIAFNGAIDEVRIYNRALSAEEILMLYQSEFQKYNSTEWRFYVNVTNLTNGTYTYYGWANDAAGNSNSTETRTLIVKTQIHINGNDDFASRASNESWAGNGTEGNPYIIENYNINASTAHGIHIENTSVYFIVRDCVIHDGGSNYNGICFYNVTDGKIDNVTSYTNKVGIYLRSSSNNNITNCNVYNNYYGIVLSESSNNEIHYNNIYNNTDYGVYNYNLETLYRANATYNWWGSAGGPSGVGPGNGDKVSQNVLYEPWLDEPAGLKTFNFGVLKRGWNLITLPLDSGLRKASELANNIGCECTHVARWVDTEFELYPGIDFKLEACVGYLVYLTAEKCYNITGYRWPSTVNLPANAWSLIGVTKVTTAPKTAEDLAAQIAGCTAVARWSLSECRFVMHLVGTAISNFEIKAGESYFVYTTQVATWDGKV